MHYQSAIGFLALRLAKDVFSLIFGKLNKSCLPIMILSAGIPDLISSSISAFTSSPALTMITFELEKRLKNCLICDGKNCLLLITSII